MAREKLQREVWDHFGYAETGSTYRRNVEIFRKFLLKQRLFHGYTTADTTIELFNQKIQTPVFVAPIGSFHLVGPQTEVQVVSGTLDAKSLLFVSQFYNSSLEDLAKLPHPPMVWQGYLTSSYDDLAKKMRLAERAGFVGVGVTIDGTQPGKIGDRIIPGRGRSNPVMNDDIRKLRMETSLPFFVKGIMTAEDASLAVDAGADIIVISNHGGRIADYSRSPIEVIPEVIKAIGNRAVVITDSGFRRGTDVMKALALGAKAVLIGRPIVWGAAVGGSEGVSAILTKITEELRRSMVICGVPSLDKLSEKVLIRDAA